MAKNSTCQSSCEVGNTNYHNNSEEVTLYTVFLKIGKLEGTVKALSDNVAAVQEEQQIINRSFGNIEAIANKPHECVNGDRIKEVEDDIEDLQEVKNQAIGGKAMLVFMITLLVLMTGTGIGLWVQYKSAQKMNELEIRLLKQEKDIGVIHE